MSIRSRFDVACYKLNKKILRWIVDDEGDIGLEIAGLLTITKYKEHAIIRFGKKYETAPKWFRKE